MAPWVRPQGFDEDAPQSVRDIAAKFDGSGFWFVLCAALPLLTLLAGDVPIVWGLTTAIVVAMCLAAAVYLFYLASQLRKYQSWALKRAETVFRVELIVVPTLIALVVPVLILLRTDVVMVILAVPLCVLVGGVFVIRRRQMLHILRDFQQFVESDSDTEPRGVMVRKR